jgi:hypothetical protein
MCIVLLESAQVPPDIVEEAQSSPGCGDRGVNPRIKARSVLGDADEQICVPSSFSELLKVICVPIDVLRALEVRVGFQLDESLVLLVLLTLVQIPPRSGMERGGPRSGVLPTFWPHLSP